MFGGEKKKTKENKPILKGCPRKNICKYQHVNRIVFSCSACSQKEICLKRQLCYYCMLLLSDTPYIKHEACTKVNLHCTMPLFPITKMVELLFVSHDHVWNIVLIKTIVIPRNCKACLCVNCWYSRKIRM